MIGFPNSKVITLCDNSIIKESIVKDALGIIDDHEYLTILKSILDSNKTM